MPERRLISKVHKSNYFAFKQPPWIQSIIISACARPIFFLPARRVKNIKIIARNGECWSANSPCAYVCDVNTRAHILCHRVICSLFSDECLQKWLCMRPNPHSRRIGIFYIYSTPMYIVMDKRTYPLALWRAGKTRLSHQLWVRNHKWCGQLQHSIIFLFARSATRCAVSWMPLARQRQMWRMSMSFSTMPKHVLI
jgi:hypothetical protein